MLDRSSCNVAVPSFRGPQTTNQPVQHKVEFPPEHIMNKVDAKPHQSPQRLADSARGSMGERQLPNLPPACSVRAIFIYSQDVISTWLKLHRIHVDSYRPLN